MLITHYYLLFDIPLFREPPFSNPADIPTMFQTHYTLSQYIPNPPTHRVLPQVPRGAVQHRGGPPLRLHPAVVPAPEERGRGDEAGGGGQGGQAVALSSRGAQCRN